MLIISFVLLVFPQRAPAPLVFTPGEGWSYKTPGTDSGHWKRDRAKPQLDVARQAFEEGRYGTAIKAARRIANQWPLSDYTGQARYLLGKAYEQKGNAKKAFDAYQVLLQKHPKFDQYEEVLKRQFEIANRYLNGKRFKLWGLFPLYKSMEKTIEMYEKVIKNGPYSKIAAQAQLKIGQAQEKRSKYNEAVAAYEKAADRYHDRPRIAADAVYKAGLAYQEQAREAGYDQSAAKKAIETFSDFVALYPEDPRVPEVKERIQSLEQEQARGSFNVAQFYERNGDLEGALIYYNEVVRMAPENSPFYEKARRRIEAIQQRREDTESAQS